MADIQKGSGGTVILWIVGAVLVGLVLAQIKGGRDGCEASGRTPHGLECLGPAPSSTP